MPDHHMIVKNGETALSNRVEAMGTLGDPDSLESHEAFDVQRSVLWVLFVETFGLVLVVGALIGTELIFGTFPAVMLMGALGGFVSALRRFYGFEEIVPGAYLRWLRGNWSYVWLYSATPPLIGALAAGVLFLVFASGMVSGMAAAPKFTCDPPFDKHVHDFMAFVRCLRLDESKDYAAALLWGFVAGFSERLVPDLMTQIAGQKEHHAVKSKATGSSNSVAIRKS